MGYEDPRGRNPQFPDRPTHQDFIDLSDVAQGNDTRAEAGMATPLEILGIDQESLLYFITGRFGVLFMATEGRIPAEPDPLMVALYMDAMAIGKGFAEHRAR